MEDDLSALENSLHHVLSRVDDEYKKGDFNYVSEVAKALTSKEGPEQKLSELNQLHQQLDSEIQKVVNENYMGFNKSISNFSDILHNLKSSQDSIAVLKKQVCKCRELLTSRSEDLGQLYSADLKQRELIRILSFVESIQQVPERLKRAIERKEYDRAVPMLNKALDKDLARQELQNIRALDEIRKDLEATKQNLVNQLLDELRENVYENLDQISVPAMKSNLVSNLKKSFDLNLDPIAESREQLTLIVATLGDMGKLDKAHAWLVQRVGDELERIVRNHVEYFAHGFTETHSGWEPLEDHMTAEESTRAMLQMPYLREMLEGLLSKLYNMMSKLEFVISAISFRNAPSDNDTPRSSYSATSPSSIPARHSNNTEDTDTDVWLDLALSPDMLRRVREGLSASASSGSYEDPAFVPAVRRFANEALGSEITSIVGNNAYDSGAVRLVTLKTVFETLVSKKIQDLEGKVAEEHRVKVLGHEFLQLAVRALGLHQGASALGINHIWKQTQVKLKQLLTELLDTDHDQQQQQQQKYYSHSYQTYHPYSSYYQQSNDSNYSNQIKQSGNYSIIEQKQKQQQKSPKQHQQRISTNYRDTYSLNNSISTIQVEPQLKNAPENPEFRKLVSKVKMPRKTPNGKKRKQVKKACTNCRRTHMSCDDSRPCKRCVKLGIGDQCKDGESKKRGRPRKKPIESDEPLNKQMKTEHTSSPSSISSSTDSTLNSKSTEEYNINQSSFSGSNSSQCFTSQFKLS
eukprot:gb/GECH01003629.1/.p1 GENE.gb/GECH01003629.1/~~gb/GECH01003629.1/.p1  ORF type:complete len:748 (+),score=179.23 gb/GECH01003629.1/:1-2244(+)